VRKKKREQEAGGSGQEGGTECEQVGGRGGARSWTEGGDQEGNGKGEQEAGGSMSKNAEEMVGVWEGSKKLGGGGVEQEGRREGE
jgi:hypothetical protein